MPQSDYTKQTEWVAYADEADLLNVALFGCTAKQWRRANVELAKKNNIRDFASINELTVLSNLKTHNAELIKEGKSKEERLATTNNAIFLKIINLSIEFVVLFAVWKHN
ncbi:hypothetical protein [Dehalobacter sp. TBBPA1]|uniref:hypothetical protein n=1 Tax=Dehalobacter sp. TBBPA1 TaxID=3235037 RepID=UPI0034A28047